MDLFNYLLGGFYFFIATLIAFYIPGNLFTQKLKLPIIPKITSSFILGICIWAIQGFILGYLGLRNLTYLYLAISLLLWLFFNFYHKKINYKFNINFDKKDLIIFLILISGISLQIFSIVGNAIQLKSGIFFCCGGADTLYHGALVKELINNFPPNEAAINGVILKNYHYLSNLIIADLIRIFKLPFIATEFNFMPIFFSILFGMVAYSFAKILNLGKNFIILYLILIFFFADIFYLLTLITTKKLVFNVETIETSLSLWISYSRYFGIVIFLQALIFLFLWIKNKSIKYLLPLVLAAGVLIGIKVYIGIYFLIGILFLAIFLLFKKDLKNFLHLISIFALSALFFIPVNSSSGGLIFTGFWRSRDFIVNPNLNLSQLELARQIFEKAGNIKRYLFDFMFLGIYLFFSTGILILSIFNPIKNLKRIPIELHIFLVSSFFITFILGMFFIQKTGGSNSGQFLISIFLFGTIYSALFLDYLLLKNKFIFNLLIIFFILLTIPKIFHLSIINIDKLKTKEGVMVSKNHLNAFNYINNNLPKNSVIIIDPNLNYTCLTLPVFTHSKSFFCSGGSPMDRGIKLDLFEKQIKLAMIRNQEFNNIDFDFILANSNTKLSKKYKLLYKNSEVMILKHD